MKLLLLLAGLLLPDLLMSAALAATPLRVTMLLEFSEQGAEAYQLQQQQWQLLRDFAGDQLDVSYEHVSLQRSLELVQQDGFCSLNKRKTSQREQQLLFSRYPLNIGAPLKLIHPATQPLPADVDLAGWLATSPRLKIGIAAGRSYGPALDALIAQQSARFYQVAGADSHTKLWQMLQKGRLDALIDYSARSNLLAKQSDDIEATTIRGEPHFIVGYLVCRRSERGQQLISLFDQLLQQPSLQQQLLHNYQQYFSPKEWQQVSSGITKLFLPE
ncbi:MAG: hypothetical protein U5L02_15650 [Rheinheimera sp.]|nr:hypothetical protein [Rheinheimera sp.]